MNRDVIVLLLQFYFQNFSKHFPQPLLLGSIEIMLKKAKNYGMTPL